MKCDNQFLCFYIVLFITLFSCGFQKDDGTKESPSGLLLNNTVKFPTEVKILKNNQFISIESFFGDIEGKLKIITIVDGTCMKCVYQLNRIDSVFSTVLNNHARLLIVLNVNSKDSSYFMRNLYPEINTTGTLLWDNNFNFERKNNLFTSDVNLRTFLLDQENKITQFGNPILYPELLDEYKEKIKVYQNNL